MNEIEVSISTINKLKDNKDLTSQLVRMHIQVETLKYIARDLTGMSNSKFKKLNIEQAIINIKEQNPKINDKLLDSVRLLRNTLIHQPAHLYPAFLNTKNIDFVLALMDNNFKELVSEMGYKVEEEYVVSKTVTDTLRSGLDSLVLKAEEASKPKQTSQQTLTSSQLDRFRMDK